MEKQELLDRLRRAHEWLHLGYVWQPIIELESIMNDLEEDTGAEPARFRGHEDSARAAAGRHRAN